MLKKKWSIDSVKKGDIIHTCSGYNKIVKEVEEDGTIVTEDRCNCDFGHCCSKPFTREQIVEYFNRWGSKEGMKEAKKWWDDDHELFRIIRALKAGKRVFDDKGLLVPSDIIEKKRKGKKNAKR